MGHLQEQCAVLTPEASFQPHIISYLERVLKRNAINSASSACPAVVTTSLLPTSQGQQLFAERVDTNKEESRSLYFQMIC